MSWHPEHHYVYPTVNEEARPKIAPDHDDFAEGLELNDSEIWDFCIIAYAKRLVKDRPPEITETKPILALAPNPPSNVKYLEDYKNGTSPAA